MKVRDPRQLGLKDLSVVSPVYRSDSLVLRLVEEIRAVLSGKDYEIVLVDDGSPDASWERIQEAAARFPEVRGIRLSRNFGQHYAISAGLQESRGKKTVVLDCDLQDRPAEIPRLLAKASEGYDIVLAQRGRRRDGIGKRLGSFLFYRVLSWLTGTPQDPSIANFGVYDRRVVEAINSLSETIRYFPTMVRWVGFRSTTLPVEHQARPHGRSSYRLFQRFQLALDICLAYSDKPLRWVVMAGFAISLLGFIFAIYTLSLAIAGKIQVLGYASLMVSLWCLVGLNILIVGVVGLYVGKSFDGIKRRPPYIVDSQVNVDVPDPTV